MKRPRLKMPKTRLDVAMIQVGSFLAMYGLWELAGRAVTTLVVGLAILLVGILL